MDERRRRLRSIMQGEAFNFSFAPFTIRLPPGLELSELSQSESHRDDTIDASIVLIASAVVVLLPEHATSVSPVSPSTMPRDTHE
jgi:hypothetical protein